LFGNPIPLWVLRIVIILTPCVPLSLKGEGERCGRGASLLFDASLVSLSFKGEGEMWVPKGR